MSGGVVYLSEPFVCLCDVLLIADGVIRAGSHGIMIESERRRKHGGRVVSHTHRFF